MNTLSWALTAQILINVETYPLLRKHWRGLINSERKHELLAGHHLLYLALLGKDWRKSFTPPTNRRKLENGAHQGWILFRALRLLHSKSEEAQLLDPFDGLVTPQMLANLRRVISQSNPYSHRAEQFEGGCFPFEAYTLPEASSGQE